MDTLEHGEMAFEGPDVLAAMAERGIVLVPTLCVFDLVADRDLFPEWMRERARFLRESAEKTVAAARAEGVAMAMGADAGPHGENARELVRLVEAGLTPMEGIVAGNRYRRPDVRAGGGGGHDRRGEGRRPARARRGPARGPARLPRRARWLVLQGGEPVGGWPPRWAWMRWSRHVSVPRSARSRGGNRPMAPLRGASDPFFENALPTLIGQGRPVSAVKDVVVVGAGIAGLTAATRLQDLDVLVLEAEDRVGGRIKSERRGDYWVSVGAHMFPGAGIGRRRPRGRVRARDAADQREPHGARLQGHDPHGRAGGALPVPGTDVARRPRLVGPRRAQDPPRRGRVQPARAPRCPARPRPTCGSRLLAFLGDRSFAEYTGKLRPEAAALFRAVVNRLTAEPDEISAGCVVALFAHVWSEGGVVLGRNLRGGASLLPETLAARLGDRVVTGATVREVAPQDGSVRVRFERGGGEEEVVARCAIVTAPAPVARAMISNLPEETAAALDAIVYGPFVVGGIVTGETRAHAVGRSVLRPRRRQVLQHALQPRERAAGPGSRGSPEAR